MRVGFENLSGHKLKELVAGIYKPLGVENSLPFIVKQNGEYKIRWFYYKMHTSNGAVTLNIERIITLDNGGHFGITLNPQVTHCMKLETSEDDFNIDRYCEKFISYLKSEKYDEIQKMLQKSESADSMQLYSLLQEKYL